VLEGKIPPRALKMVEEWASQHQQEFMRGWKLAQGNEPPEKNSFSEYLLKGGVFGRFKDIDFGSLWIPD